MSLKAVPAAPAVPPEEFIRRTILWYRDKRKRWRNETTYAYGGNGHLGATLDELTIPFNRHFNSSDSEFAATANAMIEQR